MNFKIASTGICLPEKIVTNQDISSSIEECKKIEQLTGIKERRKASDEIATSDLALLAAKEALHAASLPADRLDQIILSTTSPDMFFPSTAAIVQGQLGAINAFAFDLSASCSGFIYSLLIASQFFQSSPDMSNILIISSEIKSRFLNKNDFNTFPLFGDGAAAVLLVKSKTGTLKYIEAGADGSKAEYINLKIDRKKILEDPVKNRPEISMAGGRLFRAAVLTIVNNIKTMLDKNSLSIADIDHFIFHQANVRILQAAAKRLDIAESKVRMSISKLGNTSSASIPITLHQSITDNKVKRGDLICMASFGGGLTWGTVLIRY